MTRFVKLLTPFRRPQPFRRFLSDRAAAEGGLFLQAAREYVAKKPANEVSWLYSKPYDRTPGNETFYTEMYQVLNLLQAMEIQPCGHVLEVGSGPGWVTEILALLGFSVDALEPTADMIAIAERRLACAFEHYRVSDPPPVRFHETTLEDCTLPGGTFDAILFHEALHHVIDEEKGLAQCFRLLRDGGVVGVSESAWVPGDRRLEEQLEEEIARFGTLESPYTREYLDALLEKHGFVDVRRYHSINGLFRREDGKRTIEELAQIPARASNNLTARKPGSLAGTSADPGKRTLAEIRVLGSRISGDRLRVEVNLRNVGETVWLAGGVEAGNVNVALRSGRPGEPGFVEAEPRQPLPGPLAPGAATTLDLEYTLPADLPGGRTWEIDLVSERLFWFSNRGTAAGTVSGAR